MRTHACADAYITAENAEDLSDVHLGVADVRMGQPSNVCLPPVEHELRLWIRV